MATIKQKGIPTRNTKGSIGDIYIDSNTGNHYQCTFAYKSGDSIECDWKLVKKGSEIKEAINKVVEEVKTPVVKEPVVEEVVEVVAEAEPINEEPVQQTKRTNYTQYSKKTK